MEIIMSLRESQMNRQQLLAAEIVHPSDRVRMIAQLQQGENSGCTAQ
jgi:hypothetical protein